MKWLMFGPIYEDLKTTTIARTEYVWVSNSVQYVTCGYVK